MVGKAVEVIQGNSMKDAHIGETVLSAAQIKQGVTAVANALNKHFAGEEIVVISVVPGGILFTADLVKELTLDLYMDTISCPHTPGDRDNQSPIVYDENIPIQGKHVVLVDDAIESGGTMKRLVAHLQQAYAPRSLSIATLLVKPGRINIPVEQYYAYEMENDDLLVGYGLPWKDKFRNIPFVAKLIQ